ncbi:MAG: plastocyanin/azurin family copper-binding protein [Solirubrobacteraceae bacterium]
MPTLSAVTLAVGLLALAGCGSSSSSTSSSTTSTAATTPATTATSTKTSSASTTPSAAASGALSLEANAEGQLKYNKTALTATAGKVSIDFTNMSPLGHNVTVESSAGKVVGATPTFQGGSKALTLELKAGTYKFFCSVPGHRMAGMEGTLTVK